ncbi:MAG: STAS domain-containing protein [Planctomycetota bacterium]|nr:STAS domain-containing protein [Planctomycetota bacterium]
MANEKLLGIKRVTDTCAVATVNAPRIDDSNYEAIGKQLLVLSKKYDITHIVVNLKAVKMLVSMALSKLLAVEKHLNSVNGELRLCCLNEITREVFKITGIDKRIPIFETEEAALNGWK